MNQKTTPSLNVKDDFPILKNIIYLDNSSTTQKPKQVIDAIKKYYEEDNANVHRGVYKLSLKATMAYEKAHAVVAKFIGAQFKEVIFTKGTTESLNLLAYSLGKKLQAGDEIVLTEMEHHSNLVPWQQLAREKDLVLKFIPITSDFRLDMDKAREYITLKTKIVSITHISNVLGTINPVKEIAALAHEAGAVMIVDAAQSVPHMPIDVKELNCDFLAFSGHKMCGPTGIGVLYGKKELLEKMDPFLYGGDMIKEVHFDHSIWNDLPWKFEAGTPNIAGAVGLAAAVEYLRKIGIENIWHYEQELTKHVLQQFSALPKIKLLGPATHEERGAVFSFTVENIHPHDVSEMLDKVNICVRGGHHCAMPLHEKLGVNSSVRASGYFYNTTEEIDALVEALAEITGKSQTNHLEITSTPLTEEQELYRENILDHYQHPRNKKVLADYTLTHREYNPLCGDEIQMYILLNHILIKDISFSGQGCAISQASASLLAEEIKGKPWGDVKKLGPWDVYNLLGIPISYARSKCALLALKTVQKALEQL